MPASREAALSALNSWRRGQSYIADGVDHASQQLQLSSQDHAHARHLALGVGRNTRLLDFWIDLLRKGEIDKRIRDILRIGLFDALIGEAPAHSAVNEAVALAPKKARGFVNAILRRALREKETLLTDSKRAEPGVWLSHPDFLLERWTKQYGEENAKALAEWNQKPAELYGRANGLREASKGRLDQIAAPLAQAPGFYRLERLPRQEIQEGLVYLQDPSTRIAVDLLDPKPGERILDACAAPGGKTTMMAERMEGEGELVSADLDEKRISRLRENLHRLGADQVRVVESDWTQPARHAALDAPFDAILLDAPCTNTGVMRRRVEVRHRLRPEEFGEMAKIQHSLLSSLLPRLTKGGRLVYSTCSLDAQENEQLISDFLKENQDFHKTGEAHSLPWRDGFDGAYAALLTRR